MPEQQKHTNILQLAEKAIRNAEGRARHFYGLSLPEATIDFSLRGRCAGQARVSKNGSTNLRINSQLLVENLEDFLHTTIPHEVAHLVVNWRARKKRLRPRPHGPEWQSVMQDCFNLEAKRCHDYQTAPARVVPRPFLYACICREHHLTSIMHKRLSNNHQALCKTCRTPVMFLRTRKQTVE
jgi:SprT protein